MHQKANGGSLFPFCFHWFFQLLGSKIRWVFSFCRELQIVFDPDDKINRLADEVDKNAPLSRLTLFSPCKVVTLNALFGVNVVFL